MGAMMVAWESDLFDRKKYADFLTAVTNNTQTPFVININSGWGMGKTFFLKNWIEDIRKNHHAVYFNAWEYDFSDDVLLSFMSCLKHYFDNNVEKDISCNIDESFSKIGSAIKSVAPEVIKGIVGKFTGIDTNEIKRVVSGLIDNEIKINDSVIEFKKLMSETVKSQINADKRLPFYIFVDELDRCRPDYAIEVLEKIKHFFDIDGFVFVVATDTWQLCHSIKSIYGEKFNSELYIKRFFDREYSLKNPNIHDFVEFNLNKYDIFNRLSKSTCSDRIRLIEVILNINSMFNFDLRSIEQVISRINAIISYSIDDAYHIEYIIFLVMLRQSNIEQYEKFFDNTLSYSQFAVEPNHIKIANGLTLLDLINFYDHVKNRNLNQFYKFYDQIEDTNALSRYLQFISRNFEVVKKYKTIIDIAGDYR